MQYTVEKKVLQEVLNYLASRPFAEVHTLVKSIQENAKLVPGSATPEAESSAQSEAAN